MKEAGRQGKSSAWEAPAVGILTKASNVVLLYECGRTLKRCKLVQSEESSKGEGVHPEIAVSYSGIERQKRHLRWM